jgi:hypothetical protein
VGRPALVLILVLGLRTGKALGLIEPDDDWRRDKNRGGDQPIAPRQSSPP